MDLNTILLLFDAGLTVVVLLLLIILIKRKDNPQNCDNGSDVERQKLYDTLVKITEDLQKTV